MPKENYPQKKLQAKRKFEETIEIPSGEHLRSWQEKLVGGTLRTFVIIGIFAAIATGINAYIIQIYWPIYISIGILLIMAVIGFWPGIPYSLKTGTLIGAFYIIGTLNLSAIGPTSESGGFFISLIFIGGLLLGKRGRIAILILSIITFIFFAFAITTGLIEIASQPDFSTQAGWLRRIVNLLLLGIFITVALNYLMPRFTSSLEQSQQYARQLRKQRDQLEDQVKKRTKSLEQQSKNLEIANTQNQKRATQLETVAEIANSIACQELR